MRNKKRLYQGIFNYQREIHIIHRYARDESDAKCLMLQELARRLDTSVRMLKFYFDGSSDNFKIKEVQRECR